MQLFPTTASFRGLAEHEAQALVQAFSDADGVDYVAFAQLVEMPPRT